jgi:NMD protein affecting ribosome stability and mRNA decay
MLNYTKLKEKEVKIEDLKEGQVIQVGGKLFAFVRVKKGFKSLVATNLEDERDYSIKILFSNTKTVVGKLKAEKKVKSDNSILVKDVKVGETVVIMSNRDNAELYTLVGITKKAYSHTFENPVTKKRVNYKGNDSWKVYRLNDIIKK